MNKLFFIFLISALPQLLWAQEYKCPKDNVLVDFTSPITNERQVFCQMRKDGKLVKNGMELTFNPKGEIIKKVFYRDGVGTDGKADRPVTVDKKEKK